MSFVIANEMVGLKIPSLRTKCWVSKCRHCERSEAIQQDKNAFFKATWIATSVSPPRNDDVFWIAASATPPRNDKAFSIPAFAGMTACML
ncbi:MAG: hypothetical protein AWT59_2324 [Candidatus Gallionella acididurans]|uniref:Uncharacterized protein n=1 Tax=Candidatus Gallionella acididurans TaxID=1796491 RepID=A0A139BRB3_9PROT|nr:MAG: hypothetical protein AWT59_2324 [Candidatus Gallionella acididurans]